MLASSERIKKGVAEVKSNQRVEYRSSMVLYRVYTFQV